MTVLKYSFWKSSKNKTLVHSYILSVCFFLLFVTDGAVGQTLPTGSVFLEEYQRRKQVRGDSSMDYSFTVRPISLSVRKTLVQDSMGLSAGSSTDKTPNTFIEYLPVTFNQQYNNRLPYGWNDGSMIPSRGYQNQLSLGVYSKVGPLSVQVQPEFVYAFNRDFPTFAAMHNDSLLKTYYQHYSNSIDEPEQFGQSNYIKAFPGQSSLRFNYKRFSAGVSTENLWWGPGIRNSLLMSNNAPGFPHLTFNTTAPVRSVIGSFEGQIISGWLKGSGIIPADTGRTFHGNKFYEPKSSESRYLNGMVISWQPRWTKGLYLGFSRVFYLYKSNVKSSLNGFLPVISNFFKENTPNEDSLKRDQMLSVFFRLSLPKEKAEFYMEFGKNDHSADMRDLLLEFEHARAYIIGGRKLFSSGRHADIELMVELTQLQQPPTARLRAMGSWYAHNLVKHGYTNYGQVIGAGIGSGGSSQTIGVSYLKGIKTLGLRFERVVRKNDLYYDMFEPVRNFSSHWVDLSVNLNGTWHYKRFIFLANLTRIKSLNYQWEQYTDKKNWQAQLSTSYLF